MNLPLQVEAQLSARAPGEKQLLAELLGRWVMLAGGFDDAPWTHTF